MLIFIRKKTSSNWHNLSRPILAKHKIISFSGFKLKYQKKKTVYTFIINIALYKVIQSDVNNK